MACGSCRELLYRRFPFCKLGSLRSTAKIWDELVPLPKTKCTIAFYKPFSRKGRSLVKQRGVSSGFGW